MLSKINLAFKKNETFIPKETKHTNDDEEEKDDNIDAAKIWAKQQKQNKVPRIRLLYLVPMIYRATLPDNLSVTRP